MKPTEPLIANLAGRGRHLLRIGLILAFVGLCAWPYVAWAQHPSLFDDDLTRVGSLRRSTPATSLFRPFNEHLAPLFELVSWLSWWSVGRRVERIASGFLVASYLMAFSTLFALVAVVRLELRSNLAAMVAACLFALSTVSAETVLWYSASSFQGAAASSLAAWFSATKAVRSTSPKSRTGWLVASALFVLASPLFSAIGALAGPLATLRILSTSEPDRLRFGRRRSWLLASIVPLLGTLADFLLLAMVRDHGATVSASVRQHLDIAAALWATIRAPSLVLIPEMIGVGSLSSTMLDRSAALSTLALGVGVLIWARRCSGHRGLILAGLGWVIGGYLLAYLARAQAGDRWIFEVGRYHLFPEVGVICWASALLGPRLDRLEAWRPPMGWLGLLIVALVAFTTHGAAMGELARRSFRYPEQGRSIASALRLEATCQAEQIPFEQAVRIIDPVEPRWFPRPLPFHPLLYLFGPGPTQRRWSDAEARSRVFASLSADDREAIFGGLDPARYPALENDPARGGAWIDFEAGGGGVESVTGEGRTYFAEFTRATNTGEVSSLRFSGIKPGTRLELWWSPGGGHWSSGRSVRCLIRSEGEVIPLSRLPHWRTGFARRFRLVRRGWPLPTTDRQGVSCQLVPG